MSPPNPNLEWDDLRIALAIGRTRSLSAAARTLGAVREPAGVASRSRQPLSAMIGVRIAGKDVSHAVRKMKHQTGTYRRVAIRVELIPDDSIVKQIRETPASVLEQLTAIFRLVEPSRPGAEFVLRHLPRHVRPNVR